MIEGAIRVLIGTAAVLGFVHTVVGPDHYVPFIAMSKARGWPLRKTLLVALAAGLGHILSSVVLGLLGVAFGVALSRLEALESLRGEIAVWLLIGFGFAYFVWGLQRAIRNRPHEHLHRHDAEGQHRHRHRHDGEHVHVHDQGSTSITPWVLFTIFLFGPCEPLIPLLMYPAAKQSVLGLALVTLAFGATTLGTMLAIIAASAWGLRWIPFGRLQRYTHALAGAAILASGLSVRFLGL